MKPVVNLSEVRRMVAARRLKLNQRALSYLRDEIHRRVEMALDVLAAKKWSKEKPFGPWQVKDALDSVKSADPGSYKYEWGVDR